MSVELREPRCEREWIDFARVSIETFGGDDTAEERGNRWRLGWGSPSLGLVAVRDGVVVGGVCVTPVEQFFGGRPVWSGAPIATCLLPEHRRERIGSTMVSHLIRLMMDAGLSISTGWPSTVSLYGRLGWEVVGREVSRRVDTRQLMSIRGVGALEPDPLSLRREEAIALQRSCAEGWNGPFVRHKAWWDIQHPEAAPRYQQRYGWTENGKLTGLIVAEREQRKLSVSDLWTSTPDALRGLLGYLGSHETVIDQVVFKGGAQPVHDEISGLLPRPRIELEAGLPWVLRVNDPMKALVERGYGTAFDCRLDLELTDRPDKEPVRFVLEVSGGRASVVEGGSGSLRIKYTAFARWYAGVLPMSRAAMLGLVAGTPAEIELFAALAGDRSPWLPEHF